MKLIKIVLFVVKQCRLHTSGMVSTRNNAESNKRSASSLDNRDEERLWEMAHEHVESYKDKDTMSNAPFLGVQSRLFVTITPLHKLENFIRKFLITYHVSLTKFPRCETKAVDMYLYVQNEVDVYQTRTTDRQYSYREVGFLYEFLRHQYPFDEDLVHGELVRLQKSYDTLRRKRQSLKRRKCKVPAELSEENYDGTKFMRNPFLQLTSDSFTWTHLLRHLRYFCDVFFGDTGLSFDWSRELGHHVICLSDIYKSEPLTMILEKPMSDRAVDRRSAVEVNSKDLPAHGFGVASYISHGCSKHTQFLFPCMSQYGIYYAFRRKKGCASRCVQDCVLRVNYGRKAFGNSKDIICVDGDCFA